MLDFRNKTGFTIIEVVLVLAIAGLIFLMVFVALPSLQRSQRDAQRRQDVSKVASAVTNWLANGNSFSGYSRCTSDSDNTACDLVKNYLNNKISSPSSQDNTFKDPLGKNYLLYVSPYSTGLSAAQKKIIYMKSSPYDQFGTYTLIVTYGTKCDPTDTDHGGIAQADSAGNNYFAVRYRLEDGGIYCVDNQ